MLRSYSPVKALKMAARKLGLVQEGALADAAKTTVVIMKDGKVYKNSVR
jgi:hypothetical protein